MMADTAYTGCFRQLYYASFGNYRKIFISEAPFFPIPANFPFIKTDKENFLVGDERDEINGEIFVKLMNM